jgi:hypothetical protein
MAEYSPWPAGCARKVLVQEHRVIGTLRRTRGFPAPEELVERSGDHSRTGHQALVPSMGHLYKTQPIGDTSRKQVWEVIPWQALLTYKRRKESSKDLRRNSLYNFTLGHASAVGTTASSELRGTRQYAALGSGLGLRSGSGSGLR